MAKKGVKVTYLVCEHGRQHLQVLLAITHLDHFIKVLAVGDA